MHTEQNKSLIRRFYAECLDKDPDLLDVFFTEDYIHHSERWKNLEEFKNILRELHAVYNNVESTIELMIAENDKVAVIARTACTGMGDEKVISASFIYGVRDEKITDTWGYSNSFF